MRNSHQVYAFNKSKYLIKKIGFIFSVLACFSIISITASGQTVTGKIHDKDGNAVPFAALEQAKNNTVYADKNGKFSIPAQQGDVIVISAIGYKDVKQIVPKSLEVDVLLEKDKSKSDAKTDVTNKYDSSAALGVHNQIDEDQIIFTLNNSNSSFTSFPIIHQNDATQGSPYLFDKWLKGSVINTSGATVSNDSYLFNFDKLSQNLLMTQDQKNMIEIDRSIIQSVTLNAGNGSILFEKVEIDKQPKLLQVLAKGAKYSLYKANATKFERANYISTGLTESGHNYDLYIDKPVYYIYSLATKQLIPVELKKKALKDAFPKAQADAYFSQHADMSIDESFAIGLVNSFN